MTPFRAAVLLLFVVIGTDMIIALSAVLSCEYGVLTGKLPMGSCKDLGIPDFLGTTLASVLVLLNYRPPPKE